MSVAQWIFHYIEIMKGKKEDVNISKDILNLSLRTITEDIELLGVLINKENGIAMIEAKEKIRTKKKEDTENISSESKPAIKNEDAELLDFFNSVPEFMAPTAQQNSVGKFFLPTVDVKEKMKLGFDNNKVQSDTTEKSAAQPQGTESNMPELEIIDDIDSDNKPKLGF